MKTLVYKITTRGHYGYEQIRDMFRYSGHRPSKVESWIRGKPKIFIMRGPLKHRVRSKKFFHSQIERRWESFGCEVEIIGEENADLEDRRYRYDVTGTEELMKRLVLESRAHCPASG